MDEGTLTGGPPKMRWIFGENPDIHTFGSYLPARKRKIARSERRKKWD
jgi:hypothetical protein